MSGAGVKLARQADTYLRSNLQAPLTIRDLCTAMGVPERTLFKADAYAPRALTQGTPQDPSAQCGSPRAASRPYQAPESWMSPCAGDSSTRAGFSQDYRQQFGETPSTTLRNTES
jgi:hypothetical protein